MSETEATEADAPVPDGGAAAGSDATAAAAGSDATAAPEADPAQVAQDRAERTPAADATALRDYGADGMRNPLRDPADRRLPRVPEPCALVIFGIGGDLARKKLIPAVYDLANRGLLPTDFVVLGLSRTDWPGGGKFEEMSRKSARDGARTSWNEEVWKRLANNTHFIEGSFDDDHAFDELVSALRDMQQSHGIRGNAAFYLSIPPSLFPTVLKQMQRTGLSDEKQAGGWRRVVVEKPFGHDLASALELNKLVDDVFPPRDVYRIDHYLGKETVQNLLALRFANLWFEPVWNANYVDSVQITMAEDVGIGGRAAFYQATGAARDVLQNHLLQLLALTAMEEPVEFSPEAVRIEKLKALRAISLPADLGAYAVRGQYDQGWLAGERAVAFRAEDGIPPDSRTETYAAVRLGVETRRWAGVPFYLRTGKRLPKRVTEIAVIYKKAPHLPFSKTDTQELGHNQLVVRVQPDEGVTLKFGSKVPGSAMEVRDVAMDFLYGEAFTESSPEAYERLILDVLIGDATLFPRSEEVEASWRVIDPLEEFWAGSEPDLYRAGEWGPKEADDMLARDGRSWRRP
jgi:glucose-6-phosphate 1-dehydrogenase